MPRSSLITKPVRPIRSRITSAIITGEVLAGARSSKAGSRTWAVMASGASRSAWNGRKSTEFELRRRHVDAGQRQMAVGLGPAVARHMLDHRQHAAGQAPFHDRPSQRDDDVGIGAVGAVADDLVRSLLPVTSSTGMVLTLMPRS